MKVQKWPTFKICQRREVLIELVKLAIIVGRRDLCSNVRLEKITFCHDLTKFKTTFCECIKFLVTGIRLGAPVDNLYSFA